MATVAKDVCWKCGAHIGYGERVRVTFQEDSTKFDYYRHRRWSGMRKVAYLCHGCADAVWSVDLNGKEVENGY